jgi:HSP90 family molecular chaperone
MSLNVSREILQQDRQIKVIRRSLTKKVLSALIKSINREVNLMHVEDEASLNSTIESLKRKAGEGTTGHVQS